MATVTKKTSKPVEEIGLTTDTTLQWKTLTKEEKAEILKETKLEKSDFLLRRFQVAVKKVYYQKYLRTNIAEVNAKVGSILEIKEFTPELCIEAGKMSKFIHEMIDAFNKRFKKVEDGFNLNKNETEPVESESAKKPVKKSIIKKALIEKELNVGKHFDDMNIFSSEVDDLY